MWQDCGMPHDDYIALESLRSASNPERWAAFMALAHRMTVYSEKRMGQVINKAARNIHSMDLVSDESLMDEFSGCND
jgi:hypothetical protein